MDRGAWWATVFGIAKSSTQLGNTFKEYTQGVLNTIYKCLTALLIIFFN